MKKAKYPVKWLMQTDNVVAEKIKKQIHKKGNCVNYNIFEQVAFTVFCAINISPKLIKCKAHKESEYITNGFIYEVVLRKGEGGYPKNKKAHGSSCKSYNPEFEEFMKKRILPDPKTEI